ncbi:MAG: anthranilate synthase component I [Deltaproteobacteria bacterium]|nr:anthranilate synthase component I [Deltaproteobacteria bacterium]
MLIRNFPDKKEFMRLYETHSVVPVCHEILADMETPVSVLFKTYPQKGPAFLFESVEGGERWGRYSFVSTSARSHISVFQTHVEIVTNGETEKIEHDNKPLDVIRAFMSGFNAPELPGLPRFWGGLVGYFTYETISFFERIENRLDKKSPIIRLILPDSIMIFDNIRNTLMMVAICFKKDEPDALLAYENAVERIRKMTRRIREPVKIDEPSFKKGVNTGLELTPLTTPDNFRKKVETVKKHIIAGDVIQAVISQPFVCDAPIDPLTLYRAQRYINPSPYMFFMHIDDMVLVGSSPETMVRLEHGTATLRPIAGTRPRGDSEQKDLHLANDLLADEKERAEHLMLVDLGRNDLGRVAETGTVQVTDLMVVERYSHVMHLVSNIRCDIKTGLDAWDLLAATFPAGTLSGAPKVRAMEIIAGLEEFPRGPYGGAVGYVSFDGNMDLAITIRTACIENKRLMVRAGAGIVYDSDPESERIETINKAMSVQKAIEMTAQRVTGRRG